MDPSDEDRLAREHGRFLARALNARRQHPIIAALAQRESASADLPHEPSGSDAADEPARDWLGRALGA